MTVPDVAACIESINILEESTELVDKLWSNADFFKTEKLAPHDATFDVSDEELDTVFNFSE